MERSRHRAYYLLFKACRLCGKGSGYMMPIVLGPPDPHQVEPELRHKIKDCCSIDVQPDDKMPPLICELCVDKVNDFYEFREMCQATNIRVRTSLGLPPQTMSQHVSEDCILGVSGPLIYDSKQYDSPAKTEPIPTKSKGKVSFAPPEKGSGKKKQKELPPPPSKKVTKIEPKIEIPEVRSRRRDRNAQPMLVELTSGMKRRTSSPLSVPTSKRIKNSAIVLPKKVEKQVAVVPPKAKVEPKKVKETPKILPYSCDICNTGFSKLPSFRSHFELKHTVVIFPEKYGCAPCREWFLTPRAAEDHHKWHKTMSKFYKCARCSGEFKVLQSYTKHFALKQCIPEEIVPDKQCNVCLKNFPTENLLNTHNCKGPPKTLGCNNCNESFLSRILLRKHQKTCKAVSPAVNPNNPYLRTLKPIHVSMAKCDNILERIKKEPIDNVDSEPVYDISVLDIIKSEPDYEGFDCGIYNLKQEIKEEMDYFDHHGDNDSSSDSECEDVNPFPRKSITDVESLSYMTLRLIFSSKYFIKTKPPRVQTQNRKKNVSDVFDSLLEEPEPGDFDVDSVSRNQNVESTESVSHIVISNVTSGADISNTEKEDSRNDNTECAGEKADLLSGIESNLKEKNVEPDHSGNEVDNNQDESTNVVDEIIKEVDVDEQVNRDEELSKNNGEDVLMDEVCDEDHKQDTLMDVGVDSKNVLELECRKAPENVLESNKQDFALDVAFDVENDLEADSQKSSENQLKNKQDFTLDVAFDNVNVLEECTQKSSECLLENNKQDFALDVFDNPNILEGDIQKTTENILNDNKQEFTLDDSFSDQNPTTDKNRDSPMNNTYSEENLLKDDQNDFSMDVSFSDNILEDDKRDETVVDAVCSDDSHKDTTMDVNDGNEKDTSMEVEDVNEGAPSATPIEFETATSTNEEIIQTKSDNIQKDVNEQEFCVYGENSTNFESPEEEFPSMVTESIIDNMSKPEEPSIAGKDEHVQNGTISENDSNREVVPSTTENEDFDLESMLLGDVPSSKDQTETFEADGFLEGVETSKGADVVKCADREFKALPDGVVDQTENDILDLVSDSGDDCNIIDSPDKLKALEDQLLAGDD